MSSLSQGLDTIDLAEKDLGSPAQIPALGSDPVRYKMCGFRSYTRCVLIITEKTFECIIKNVD